MRPDKINITAAGESQLCLFLFLFFASVFLLFFNGHYGGDGLESYLTAESIVLDRDLSIHDRPFDISQMHYKVRGHVGGEGKIYSTQGLALPLILVPFYLFGYLISNLFHGIPRAYITQFCVGMSNPILLAILGMVLFKLLRELEFKLDVSLVTAILYSFCTMNFIYSRSGFAEPFVCLLLVLSVSHLIRYEKYARISNIFISSVFLGYTMFIKKNSLIFLLPYIGYLVYLHIKYRQRFDSPFYIFRYWFSFIVPLIFFFGLILLQNILLYGGMGNTEFGSLDNILTVAKSGYGPMPVTFNSAQYGHQFMRGAFYFLISSGKGYFIYNIIFLPALLAMFPAFFRRHRAALVFAAVLVFFNFSFYIQRFIRGSLFSWGPRYLFPTLPFMAIFLAVFIEDGKRLARKVMLYTLGALGFLMHLPALFIAYSNFFLFVKEKLQLQEYLIDFLPELSPIRGSWFLLISFIKRKLSGESLSFSFNPDIRMVIPKVESLSGYDTLDIWWANILKVAPHMLPLVLALIFALLTIAILCLVKIRSLASKASIAGR